MSTYLFVIKISFSNITQYPGKLFPHVQKKDFEGIP